MFKIDAGLAHISSHESALCRERTVDGGTGEINARGAPFGMGLRPVSPDPREIEGFSLALAGDL